MVDVQYWWEKIISVDNDILNYLSYSYFATSIIVVFVLQVVSAPYGRYARSGWGYSFNAKLAWFVQELPSLLVPVFLIFISNKWTLLSFCNRIALICYIVHYFQRALIFPFLIRGGKPTPFVPFALALVFCVVNGYLQGGYILYRSPHSHLKCHHDIHFVIGILMFFSGMLINLHSDHVLRNLRRPGETGYVIPRGGMFEYVSGANFFGEILEWWGFYVMSPSLPSLAFAVFTTCNIGPRAVQHHKWYQQKFEDYPQNRKAVIPFVL